MRAAAKIILGSLLVGIFFGVSVCVIYEPNNHKSRDAKTRIILLYYLLTKDKNLAAPSNLIYSGSPYIFTSGIPITPLTPTVIGLVTECTSTPDLPTGLSIDSLTCVISGTPTVIQAATDYTITASNYSGNTSATISITINIAPPTGLVYTGSPFTFTNGITIASQTPTLSGTATNCAATPDLPSGLSIDTTTCIISGTPTIDQVATNYIITASNYSGNTITTISITINVAPPTGLVYTGSPFIFTNGITITTQTPTLAGTPANCAATPDLPSGLSLNATTCAISGTPTVDQGATNYIITASNYSGNTSTTISITINVTPPASLVYSGSSYTFTNGITIAIPTPTVIGTVTSCTSTPNLPSGLGINPTTCAISGTPTINQAATTYTITASNYSGSTTATITITINIAPPSNLVYTGSPFTFTNGIPISTKTPTIKGTITSCTSSPSLPSGLSISSTTCAISGTPTVDKPATSYTITASNYSGSATATINITINVAPPANLAYTNSSNIFISGSSIATQTPTITGTVTSCTSTPNLPSGLGINPMTCAISGTPEVDQPATPYTITASNYSGSTTATITITINIAPPTGLVYSDSPYTFTNGVTIPTKTPTIAGTITSCTSNPALPASLTINNSTCAISGTPEVDQPATPYTITAVNYMGSTTTIITITINIAPPTALTYSDSPYTFTNGVTIPTKTPTIAGTITSCTSNPALPANLTINDSTCAISGTPAVDQPATPYTITAVNYMGSTTTTITITINIAPPSNLVYAGSPYVFTTIPIITQTPTVTGTVTGCISTPELPPGFSINATTCAISGSPTANLGASPYVITASNSSGNTTTTISIEINVAAPSNLVYTGSPYTFVNKTTTTTQTPTFTGSITLCTIAPDLPPGISIDTLTCVISVNPTAYRVATDYTITASNYAGYTTAIINIDVQVLVEAFAGSLSKQTGSTDGTGTEAKFRYPLGIAVDSAGIVYVADKLNDRVRKITPAGVVTTLAGPPTAVFRSPSGLTIDIAGNIYLADTENSKIQMITPGGGAILLYAGTGVDGYADGNVTTAEFKFPYGITIDNTGTVFVADTMNHRIRKIASSTVSLVAGQADPPGNVDGVGAAASFNEPAGVVVDGSDTLYVADTKNNKIRKITADTTVSTFAGTGGTVFADGDALTVATFNTPTGVAIDSSGNVYVADKLNNRIRKITPTGVVSTIAGSSPGNTDGAGNIAKFNEPSGIAIYGTATLYIGDYGNHRIRKISL